MKKIYFEPDFDLIKIGLVADSFIASNDVESEVPTYGGEGDDFENGDGIIELQ